MKAAIDRSGRVVIPKRIRDLLQLAGGEELEVEERDGVIEIRLAPVDVEIVDESDGPVARARSAVAPLDDDAVRDTLDAVRR